MAHPTLLFTADWHLTGRPIDEYRWKIIPWLIKRIRQHNVQHLFMLGDLTDQKDGHNSVLVNRIISALKALREECPVTLLMGNHDYHDISLPYFKFLNAGWDITYIVKQTELVVGDLKILAIPHVKNWRASLSGINSSVEAPNFRGYDLILTHQCFDGAISEQGQRLDGVPPVLFSKERVGAAHVLAGDIHAPQVVGNITYCGAPYPVHFGDSYKPRVLLYQEGAMTSIERNTIYKSTLDIVEVDDLDAYELTAGDLVKVRMTLPRSRFCEWKELREAVPARAAQQGWTLCGLELKEKVLTRKTLDAVAAPVTSTPLKTWEAYVSAKQVSDAILNVGKQYL